jgi:hypothetical protein
MITKLIIPLWFVLILSITTEEAVASTTEPIMNTIQSTPMNLESIGNALTLIAYTSVACSSIWGFCIIKVTKLKYGRNKS